ncbi:hypothetical protein PIROE2DRAFT_16937 [Piromyces sp. E2]|nr:hypothetical protein PIROE2DRAFT_16937 [Piromyces sp. E2]|eukprot:OUM57928.1 hypothetical protein PIROE2DRAFT_16937 [Piromyces sp. E2]
MVYLWNSYSGISAINIIHPYFQNENGIQRDAPFINLHNFFVESHYNQEYYSTSELLSKKQFLKVNSEDLIHHPSPLKGFTSFTTRRNATTDEIHIFQLSDRGNIFYSTSLIKCHTKSVVITDSGITGATTKMKNTSIDSVTKPTPLKDLVSNKSFNQSTILNSSLEKGSSSLSKSTSQLTLVNEEDSSSFYSFLNHSLNNSTDASNQTLMNDSEVHQENKKSDDPISSLMAFDDEDEEEPLTVTLKHEENNDQVNNNHNNINIKDNSLHDNNEKISLVSSPFIQPLSDSNSVASLPPLFSQSPQIINKDTNIEASSILNNIPDKKESTMDTKENTKENVPSLKTKITTTMKNNKKFINDEILERDRVTYGTHDFSSLYQYLTKDTMLPRDINSTHGFIQYFNEEVIQREVKDGVHLMKNNIMLKSLNEIHQRLSDHANQYSSSTGLLRELPVQNYNSNVDWTNPLFRKEFHHYLKKYFPNEKIIKLGTRFLPFKENEEDLCNFFKLRECLDTILPNQDTLHPHDNPYDKDGQIRSHEAVKNFIAYSIWSASQVCHLNHRTEITHESIYRMIHDHLKVLNLHQLSQEEEEEYDGNKDKTSTTKKLLNGQFAVEHLSDEFQTLIEAFGEYKKVYDKYRKAKRVVSAKEKELGIDLGSGMYYEEVELEEGIEEEEEEEEKEDIKNDKEKEKEKKKEKEKEKKKEKEKENTQDDSKNETEKESTEPSEKKDKEVDHKPKLRLKIKTKPISKEKQKLQKKWMKQMKRELRRIRKFDSEVLPFVKNKLFVSELSPYVIPISEQTRSLLNHYEHENLIIPDQTKKQPISNYGEGDLNGVVEGEGFREDINYYQPYKKNEQNPWAYLEDIDLDQLIREDQDFEYSENDNAKDSKVKVKTEEEKRKKEEHEGRGEGEEKEKEEEEEEDDEFLSYMKSQGITKEDLEESEKRMIAIKENEEAKNSHLKEFPTETTNVALPTQDFTVHSIPDYYDTFETVSNSNDKTFETILRGNERQDRTETNITVEKKNEINENKNSEKEEKKETNLEDLNKSKELQKENNEKEGKKETNLKVSKYLKELQKENNEKNDIFSKDQNITDVMNDSPLKNSGKFMNVEKMIEEISLKTPSVLSELASIKNSNSSQKLEQLMEEMNQIESKVLENEIQTQKQGIMMENKVDTVFDHDNKQKEKEKIEGATVIPLNSMELEQEGTGKKKENTVMKEKEEKEEEKEEKDKNENESEEEEKKEEENENDIVENDKKVEKNKEIEVDVEEDEEEEEEEEEENEEVKKDNDKENKEKDNRKKSATIFQSYPSIFNTEKYKQLLLHNPSLSNIHINTRYLPILFDISLLGMSYFNMDKRTRSHYRHSQHHHPSSSSLSRVPLRRFRSHSHSSTNSLVSDEPSFLPEDSSFIQSTESMKVLPLFEESKEVQFPSTFFSINTNLISDTFKHSHQSSSSSSHNKSFELNQLLEEGGGGEEEEQQHSHTNKSSSETVSMTNTTTTNSHEPPSQSLPHRKKRRYAF